ncbi:hypothetical protein N7488_008608 [Penicillium malachiteum]|nr:hypothetical protein N7488_008608 [Penicillium malachiteum]
MRTSFFQEAFAWSLTIPEKTFQNVFLTCCGCFVLSIAFGLLRWKSDIQLLRKPPQDASHGTSNLTTDENDPVSEDDGICSEHRGQINWLAMRPWRFPLQSRSKSRRGTKPPPSERPLHILHDDRNATVDIVAVHGLAANPDYAWVWQSKNNPPDEPGYPTKDINWLRDLLPTSLSSSKVSCRIITFNYDSTWFMKAPQQRLSNISETLLQSLGKARENCGSEIADYPKAINLHWP